MTSPSERSIPELFGDAMAQLAKLVGNEFALARAEMAEKAGQAGRAAAMIGAGAVVMIPALVLLLLAAASARPAFEEKDFPCYTDDEIRAFAFDVRKLFLTERAKHLAICSRCQRRLEYWSGLVENFDRAEPQQERRADA